MNPFQARSIAMYDAYTTHDFWCEANGFCLQGLSNMLDSSCIKSSHITHLSAIFQSLFRSLTICSLCLLTVRACIFVRITKAVKMKFHNVLPAPYALHSERKIVMCHCARAPFICHCAGLGMGVLLANAKLWHTSTPMSIFVFNNEIQSDIPLFSLHGSQQTPPLNESNNVRTCNANAHDFSVEIKVRGKIQ